MTTFKPGDRFRLKGGRSAHIVGHTVSVYGPLTLVAQCGTGEYANMARPADDRPLCKACARAMERNPDDHR